MRAFILTIHHPGAEATRSLHTTGDGAYQAVVDFVEAGWDPEKMILGTGEFDCNEDMVDHFFEVNRAAGYEYTIEAEEVHGPSVATPFNALGPDEVLLTPSEVAVVLGSLIRATPAEVALEADLRGSETASFMNSAYLKLKD
jgi:hypothetical protein